MDKNFEQLITELSVSPLSDDVLPGITSYLQEQINDLKSSFISPSLLALEHWAWQLFSQNCHQWIHQSNYQELFHTLASFNFMLIFSNNHIEVDTKSSLLIPENIQWINQIFEQIEKMEDHNDPFLVIISRWFDNLSYLIHEHTQFETLSIIIHICQHIGHNYFLTDQYKSYLGELSQSQIPQSIFTAKQLFYIKTCSFIFRMYACSKADKLPFQGDDILNRYGNDYLQIILVHSHTVDSWSKELLTCITHLIDLICTCCWWGNDEAIYIKILFPSEQIFYGYIQGLIRIVSYKSFHEHIMSHWCNDETILIDSIFIFLMGALLKMKNLSSFLRSETILSNIILAIAQKSCYDRISVCAYGILAEILSDEQLKEVRITDNISEFFFHILELAWNHPTQRYKRIAIPQLLTEMSDQYLITLDILWSLSFNQDIQQQLRSNQLFTNKLTLLKENCTNEKMRKTIFGILWNLKLNHIERTISDIATFDIMISYSHKDETICKQIYEELVKSGYRVWIDFDQMHGNIMDAMAQAIEQSHTILICMSDQYRKSNYCRAEAHYAFQRQLKMVPILLQEHYLPDGWLLFLIGQLLYVDFTKYEFPRAMELLIKELKAPVIQEIQVPHAQTELDTNFVVSPSMELVKLPENILDWTEIHVQNWLIGYNLKQMARLLVDFDGSSLNSLNELITTSEPQQVLSMFQDDSLRRINEHISLLELARFRSLLNERLQRPEVRQRMKKNSNLFDLFTYCKLM